MIILKLYWWMLPIALLLIPFIYALVRERHGDYDFGLDVGCAFIVCWAGAIFFLIGHFL